MKNFILGVSITLNIILILMIGVLSYQVEETSNIYLNNYIPRVTYYSDVYETYLNTCVQYRKLEKEKCLLKAKKYLDYIKTESSYELEEGKYPYEQSGYEIKI